MDQHNLADDESMTRLNKDTAYIEAKSKLPSHLCGVRVKILSDEVKAITKMVSHEYTTALGSMRKGEMLSNLAVRLRDLFEIMTKCKKIVDMLNRRTMVAVFGAMHYSKKIKTYHKELKRIRTDLETTITRIRISWGPHADNSGRTASNKEQCPEARDSPTTTPMSAPITSAIPYGRETVLSNVVNDMPTTSDTSHYGQREQSSEIRNCSPGPAASLSNSLTNDGDKAAVASQIGEQVRTGASPSIGASTSVQPMSQEAPSASLSNTTVGDLSLNTVGNDVNNTTINDNSRHTGVGNTTVLNVQNMVFNNFWVLQ